MTGDLGLLSAIVFFAITLAAVGYYAVVRKQARFTDPILQFLFFFSLFVLPLPIRAYQTLNVEGDVTEHLPEIFPYIPEAVILCGLGLIAFTAAYYSGLPRRISRSLPQIPAGPRWGRSFLFLASLSMFLLVLLARSVGGLLSFVLLGYSATAEMVGKGYLAGGFSWLFVATLFLLYGYARERKVRYLLYFAAAMLVIVPMQVVMGRRGMLLYMGLAVWIYWHHAVRPVRARTLVLIGLLGFVGLNLVGKLRGNSYQDVDAMVSKNTEAFDQSTETGDTYFYTLTTGQFVVPFETFPQMIESVGNAVNPEFGLTYLRAPLQVIPQAVFPSRPLPLANWYVQEFYGSGYEFNQGRQFFFLSEGYLNFGILGVLATMVAWGLFLGTIHHYQRASRGNPASLLLCALIVAFIYLGISGESISWLVGLPELSLGAGLAGLWIAARGRTHRLGAPA